MSLEKVKMPELDPKVRATNFEESRLDIRRDGTGGKQQVP